MFYSNILKVDIEKFIQYLFTFLKIVHIVANNVVRLLKQDTVSIYISDLMVLEAIVGMKISIFESGQLKINFCCRCCEECGKTFNQISAYHVHLKVHSNIRDFACEDCGMTFKLKHSFVFQQLLIMLFIYRICLYCVYC